MQRDSPVLAGETRVAEVNAAPTQIHLPSPSLWPVTLAGGITLLCGGVAITWLFSAAGGLVILVALVGWVRDLRREAGGMPGHEREEAGHG